MAVDEQGTEAAAATAVIGIATGAPDPTEPVRFIADRPFLIAIVDLATDAVVFLGRVVDPAP